MKLVDLTFADWLILGPVIQKRADDGKPPFGPEWKVFPNMRASLQVVVFSSAYMVKLAEWWSAWKEATGFDYKAGSGMCESGTKVLLGHISESFLPFRGEGPVPQEILDEARAQGHVIPSSRMGDFTEGAYRFNIRIPNDSPLNGVIGPHSTPCLLVEDADGRQFAQCFEWQNQRWREWEDAVKDGVELVDVID